MNMPRDLYDDMIAHVRAAMPEEACGLIAGHGDQAVAVYPVENNLHSPTMYEMEPTQQVRAMLAIESAGWELLGIYHSHPAGPPLPSPSDTGQAYYPDAQYVIISLMDVERPVTRSYFLEDSQIREVAFTVV